MKNDSITREVIKAAESLLMACGLAQGHEEEAIRLINTISITSQSTIQTDGRGDGSLLVDAVNISDLHGGSPLIYAAKNGMNQTCKLLLDSGAVAEAALHDSGNTAMHLAALHGHLEAVKAIIFHSNSLAASLSSAKNNNGDTPLHFSAARGLLAISMQLMKAGCGPFEGNKKGVTPLMAASSAGHHLSIVAILRHSQEMKDGNKSSEVESGEEMIATLLSRQDDQGNNALHYACRSGHVECARALLEAGCDAAARNKAGRTPLLETRLLVVERHKAKTVEDKALACETLLQNWHKNHMNPLESFDAFIEPAGKGADKINVPEEVIEEEADKQLSNGPKADNEQSGEEMNKEDEALIQFDPSAPDTSPPPPLILPLANNPLPFAVVEPPVSVVVNPPMPAMVESPISIVVEHPVSAMVEPLASLNSSTNRAKESKVDMVDEIETEPVSFDDACPSLSELGIKISHAWGLELDGLSMSQLETLSLFHQRELERCLEARIRLAREQEREIVAVGIERELEIKNRSLLR